VLCARCYFKRYPGGVVEEVSLPDDRPPSSNGHKRAVAVPDSRYDGRRVDIAGLLAKPPQPTPWRCHDVVADGTLTIVGGKAGDGKSWFALALAIGVARGKPVAGIRCELGVALIVDGEMGPSMYIERLRTAGIGPEIELRDAMGLDLSKPGIWRGCARR
jgi:AAA domain